MVTSHTHGVARIIEQFVNGVVDGGETLLEGLVVEVSRVVADVLDDGGEVAEEDSQVVDGVLHEVVTWRTVDAARRKVVLVLHALVAVLAVDVRLAVTVASVSVALQRGRTIRIALARSTTRTRERVVVRLQANKQ